jgi:hypothetical protein
MPSSLKHSARQLFSAVLAVTIYLMPLASASVPAQNTVSGAFEGYVTDSSNQNPIPGVSVQFRQKETGRIQTQLTDQNGHFLQQLLPPGDYEITVNSPTLPQYKPQYRSLQLNRHLRALEPNQITPLPVALDPSPSIPTPATPSSISPVPAIRPAAPTPTPRTGGPDEPSENTSVEVNRTDGRRGGGFTIEEVRSLPLGGITLVRTFDELALLLPGVALPPQTLGMVAGPGVGPGIGSAGQFAVNGMPSRANNFLIDGSDNNDEDIGVRRQGFLSLVPQPIESIREYQVITLLAPAQFGRNIGAQVNAISLSGGNETHGTVYGFLNASPLNAPNFFDTANGNGTSRLFAGNNQAVLISPTTFDLANRTTGPIGAAQPFTTTNQSGGKDSSTLFQPGFVVGGPLKRDRAFYFVSLEKQFLNASQEANFAVPTLEQRGFSTTSGGQGSGATGLFQNCINSQLRGAACDPVNLQGQTLFGAAIFSLFPSPNNPGGVYGRNTFTQNLPANGRGIVLSGKLDYITSIGDFTARYNFSEDKRQVPVTGGALFSAMEPHVKTQNISTFLNSKLPGSLLNQLRLSYGRTHIRFDEVRDQSFLLPSRRSDAFLLNAPLIQNVTLPAGLGVANAGNISLVNITNLTTEDVTGPLGQVIVGGYSPVGVDVNNFPQRRTNNTYQLADTLAYRVGSSNYAFGADIRRTELNSFLPTNARPQASFFGGLPIQNDPAATGGLVETRRFPVFRPEDFVAAGVPTSFTQALSLEDPTIGLRYYQMNFFAQNEWRPRRNFSLSYGARYEYNTPPREMHRRIEDAYRAAEAGTGFGIVQRILAGRTQIYDPDRNNIAPRIGVAYSPNVFGPSKSPIFRGGFGVFYDQILGAVVSQSRNIFPLSFPINFAAQNSLRGGNNPIPPVSGSALNFVNPTALVVSADPLGPCIAIVGTGGTGTCLHRNNPLTFSFPTASGTLNGIPLIQPGTLNTLNQAFVNAANFNRLLLALNNDLPAGPEFTFPSKRLDMPMAYHYSYTVEQPLPHNMVASFAYVGTLGRNLLRFNTPNAGPFFNPFVNNIQPGVVGPGGGRVPQLVGGVIFPIRPVRLSNNINSFSDVGAANVFETVGRSRYDSAQAQLRGRLQNDRFQYQLAYTYSKSFDNVSDVFDLAGAPALPQDFATFAGEYARSNFDAPHRFSYNFLYNFGRAKSREGVSRALLNGLQISGTGQVQSGQPFTVNSILDVNTDGNLTDRLDNTNNLVVTGDRSQPLQLTTSDRFALRAMLANLGFSGRVPRNSFRAGNVVLLNLAVTKTFSVGEHHNFVFRAEAFNFINRTNFGIPVRVLEAQGFGRATDTVTPNRRIQFALKYSF